jgi:hypothetical protein
MILLQRDAVLASLRQYARSGQGEGRLVLIAGERASGSRCWSSDSTAI